MKRMILSFTAFMAVMAFVSLTTCGSKKPLTDEQKVFAGKWVAQDSTFVHIYLDGSGDLKTANVNVSGGTSTFSNDSLTIGFGPISKTMKITSPPKETNGRWEMALDGISFVKEPSLAK